MKRRYLEADWSPGWRDQAACRGLPTELFFNWSWSDLLQAGRPDLDRAREVCATCPVREACLADALNRRDEYGVRAGTTPRQRHTILKKQLDIPAALAYCGLEEPAGDPAGQPKEER